MAINPACFDAIAKETGRALGERELKELDTELEKRIAAARADDPNLSPADAQLKAAEKLGQDMKLAALIEKRSAILNQRKQLNLDGSMRDTWADRPVDGMQAILTGVQRSRKGGRNSVAQNQQALNKKYLGGAIADLEKIGHSKLFASGAIDEDIARALWKMDDDSPDFKGLMPEAVEVARVMHKWQEISRLDANKEGAFIGKERGYITRQSHDLHKIRKVDPAIWRDKIMPRLDLGRTVGSMPDATVAKFLGAAYDGLASGVHLKAATSPKLTGFKGPSNLAKRVSQQRVLHFKSADDWMAYNREFGTGSLREAFFGGLRHSAQSTGLLKVLGTNPGNMIDVIGRRALERITDNDTKRKFDEALKPRGKVDNRLRQVDGSVNIPGNADAARIAGNIMAVETMAKLGGAVFASLTDIPVHASEVRYQGRGMLTGMSEALGGLVAGRARGEQLQILSSVGVVFDSMIGEITRRGSLDESFSGGVARGMQSFFKYNVLNWWTDSLRSAAGLGLSHFMAKESVKAWGQLSDEWRRIFKLYDIDEPKWNVIRNGKQTLADGREYLTPDGIEDENVADALRNFYVDRVHTSVIEPDAETMAMMRRGTQPGTAEGTLLRFIGQFKSFSVAFTQKVLGREAYGYGADSLGEALRNGQSLRGLANVILMTTMFGYGAMVIKDLIKGKTPRSPTDPKTWLAAMTQGGGLGIYGDFLLGERSRMGRSLVETIAGPVPGLLSDVDELRARAMSGDDVAASSLRLAINNTPFMNLFWSRIVLDYAILYEVQESLNPGYLRRMEKRVEKENGQTFWLSPSEVVN